MKFPGKSQPAIPQPGAIGSACILLVVLIVVGNGCTGTNLRQLNRTDSPDAYRVVRISKTASAREVKARLFRLAAKEAAGSRRVHIVGLYHSRVQRAMNHWDTDLILRGERVWGGVLAIFDSRGELSMWLHEPFHRDRYISRRYGILEAGRWRMDRGTRLMRFLYFRNGVPPRPDWQPWLEQDITLLSRNFSQVRVLVFANRTECRRFASSENRRSRLLMAAISPAPRETFLKPSDSVYGYWIFSGRRAPEGGWSGSWRRVLPAIR
ncbi:MAG TPA: hypothetical protein ENN40_03685 [Candidatus Aminicenantes bacterium]|nr:hypothetical protein [Candidatus Aminicenantes bacterium]